MKKVKTLTPAQAALENKPHYLYVIALATDPSKNYVGFTCNPKERWKAHKHQARRGDGWAIHMAMAKYGIDNFTFTVVQEFQSRSAAANAEMSAISTGAYRYNLTPGGDGCIAGRVVTDEERAKISERASKPRGSMPQHQKDAIRLANQGKFQPSPSEETRRKISESKKGEIRTEEFKRRLSEYWKGKPKNPEAVEKTRQATIGVKRSEEAKANMRAAQQRRWQRVREAKLAEASPIPACLNAGTKDDTIPEQG